jgi:hypothetical protein
MPLIFPHNIFTLFKNGPFGRRIPIISQLLDLWSKLKGSVNISVSVSAKGNANSSQYSYN